jgi:hypothetical protein
MIYKNKFVKIKLCEIVKNNFNEFNDQEKMKDAYVKLTIKLPLHDLKIKFKKIKFIE